MRALLRNVEKKLGQSCAHTEAFDERGDMTVLVHALQARDLIRTRLTVESAVRARDIVDAGPLRGLGRVGLVALQRD